VFLPKENHALRISAGTAFRNPSQLENYVDFQAPAVGDLVVWSHGNEKLLSERTTAVDCGYQALIARNVAASVALFYNRIDRMIDLEAVGFFAVPPAPVFGIPSELSLSNGGSVDVWGGESTCEVTPVPWIKTGLFYTFERTTNRETHADVITSPRHQVGGLIRAFPVNGLSMEGRLLWMGETRWESINWTGPPRTTMMPDHTILEARIGYAMHRDRVEIFLAGQDLLRSAGLEHPNGMKVGRTIYGGVRMDLPAVGAKKGTHP
jgi:outer membrane receptor protein involved in Fe transport